MINDEDKNRGAKISMEYDLYCSLQKIIVVGTQRKK